MIRRPIAALLLLGACSALPSEGDGVVALEIVTPTTTILRPGTPLTLTARALDQAGAEVPAVVRWRTPDTALVTVDSVAGVIEAKVTTGTARIQAAVGSLRSDFLSFTLQAPPAVRAPR